LVSLTAAAHEYDRLDRATHPHGMPEAHLVGLLISETVLPAAADYIDAKGIGSEEFDANTFHESLSWMEILY